MKTIIRSNSKIFQKIVLGLIFFIPTISLLSCGDFVKESDSAACNSAMDSRNYDNALLTCSSRKDKASPS